MDAIEKAMFWRIRCANWAELLTTFEKFENWIFRGQVSGKWFLQSTLERHAPDTYPRHVTEYQLVHEFQRRAHNYLDGHLLPSKPGEWLALMQHFGAPTRLLDFTYSPYVAAYFAFEDLATDGSTESVIVAINPAWCYEKMGAMALKRGELFGITRDALQQAISVTKTPSYQHLPDSFVAGTLLARHIDKFAQTTLMPPMVGIFEPEKLTERMSVQQGVFLWPGAVDSTMLENIAAVGDSEKHVCEIRIPNSERGRALDQLRLMNITRTSLFSGLEGFAQSFRQLPVRESQAARSRRMMLFFLTQAPTDDPGPQGKT
jgi:hypothetical protein